MSFSCQIACFNFLRILYFSVFLKHLINTVSCIQWFFLTLQINQLFQLLFLLHFLLCAWSLFPSRWLFLFWYWLWCFNIRFYVQGFLKCLVILDCLHVFKDKRLKLWLEAPDIQRGLLTLSFAEERAIRALCRKNYRTRVCLSHLHDCSYLQLGITFPRPAPPALAWV